MNAAFHARVRDAFLTIAKREPNRCVVIDSALPKDVVLRAALEAIESRVNP